MLVHSRSWAETWHWLLRGAHFGWEWKFIGISSHLCLHSPKIVIHGTGNAAVDRMRQIDEGRKICSTSSWTFETDPNLIPIPFPEHSTTTEKSFVFRAPRIYHRTIVASSWLDGGSRLPPIFSSLINFSEAFQLGSLVCQRRVSWIFITSTFVHDGEVSISLRRRAGAAHRIQFTCALLVARKMCAEKRGQHQLDWEKSNF